MRMARYLRLDLQHDLHACFRSGVSDRMEDRLLLGASVAVRSSMDSFLAVERAVLVLLSALSRRSQMHKEEDAAARAFGRLRVACLLLALPFRV